MGVARTRLILWLCAIDCFVTVVLFWNQVEMTRLMHKILEYESVRESLPSELGDGEWYHLFFLSDYVDDTTGEWRCDHCMRFLSLPYNGDVFIVGQAHGSEFVPLMCSYCFVNYLENFIYDGGRVYVVRLYDSGDCDVLGLYCVEVYLDSGDECLDTEGEAVGLRCGECGRLIRSADGGRVDVFHLGADYVGALANALDCEGYCGACGCWEALFIALPDDPSPDYVGALCLLL